MLPKFPNKHPANLQFPFYSHSTRNRFYTRTDYCHITNTFSLNWWDPIEKAFSIIIQQIRLDGNSHAELEAPFFFIKIIALCIDREQYAINFLVVPGHTNVPAPQLRGRLQMYIFFYSSTRFNLTRNRVRRYRSNLSEGWVMRKLVHQADENPNCGTWPSILKAPTSTCLLFSHSGLSGFALILCSLSRLNWLIPKVPRHFIGPLHVIANVELT